MTSRPPLRTLTSGEFKSVDPARHLISHENARRYAAIDLGGTAGSYVLSWRSDLVEPVIDLSPAGERLWVAVDQQVACVELGSGEVQVRLPLFGNALDIDFAGDCTAVLTESEVLLFNDTLSLRALAHLPDLPESMCVSGNNLAIQFADSPALTLDVASGRLQRSG